MIILDANALISFLNSDNADFQNLREFLRKSYPHEVCIPTPALAEFLVKEENIGRIQQLMRPNSKFRKLPFDEKSATSAAKIYKDNIAILKSMEEPKQKVKVDVQILGIALSNNAKIIITHDRGIKNIIKRLDLSIEVFDYIDNAFIKEMTKLDADVIPESQQHH